MGVLLPAGRAARSTAEGPSAVMDLRCGGREFPDPFALRLRPLSVEERGK